MITTTLEQSKKLKELGAPRTTHFIWWKLSNEVKGSKEPYVASFREALPGSVEICAAYTLSELIEWLADLPVDATPYTEDNMTGSVTLTETFDFGSTRVWKAGFCYIHKEPRKGIWRNDWLKVGMGKTPLDAVYELALAINHQSKE